MTLLAVKEWIGQVFKMRRDPRISPIGRFLRKDSLDGLPKRRSAIRGDLSLVPPPLTLQTEMEQFAYWQHRRPSVKPSLRCLAGGRSTEPPRLQRVGPHRPAVHRHCSLWLDLKILLRTIPAVLRGTGV